MNKEQESKPEAEKDEIKGKRKSFSGRSRRAVILGVILLFLLASGYVGGAIYYRTRFFPGSSVNGIDCGNKKAEEVAVQVDEQIKSYSLRVQGRDYATGEAAALIGEIMPEDISLSFVDSLGAVKEALAGQNEWSWIFSYNGKRTNGYSLVQGLQFDQDRLKAFVGGWEACTEENMLWPQDAYVSDYVDETGGYQVVPETLSTALDMDKVLGCISDAISAKQASIDLEEALCYIEPKVTQTDEQLQDFVVRANTWLGSRITYDWNGSEVVLDRETLKDWISIEQDGPLLDQEAVKDFVKQQAKEYDTYGKTKSFVTALGIELPLNSPNYGWKTDIEQETQELTALICQGSVTKREPIYSVTARAKGAKDIGGSYVEADLTHQHLYLYQGGQVVLETDFVSGKMPESASPSGIFSLTYKTRDATLRGTDYASFVYYWMPFFGNYGMHDATWRTDFGGTIYQNYGSHGCLNLPLDAAAVIYEAVSKGFPVICYYYEVDPLAPPEAALMPPAEELLMQMEAGW